MDKPENLGDESLRDLAFNMGIAYSLICRDYLNRVDAAEIIPLSEHEKSRKFHEHMRLFKISSFVYDKIESITDKLNSMFAAISLIQNCNVFMILSNVVDEKGDENLELYMGVSGGFVEELKEADAILERSISGNFPGCQVHNCYDSEIKKIIPSLIYQNAKNNCSISSVSVDAVQRNNNGSFIQGMEKFTDAMRGVNYTLMLVASPVAKDVLEKSIQAYRELYTQLSPYKIRTETFNESLSEGMNISFGTQIAETLSRSKSYTKSFSMTRTAGTGTNVSGAKPKLSGSFLEIGLTALGIAAGYAFGAPIIVSGFAGNLLGKKIGEHLSISPETVTTIEQNSQAETEQEAHGEQEQFGIQHAQNQSQALNKNLSKGFSVQVSSENKHISDMLQSIDRQIVRMNSALGQGAYNTSAYIFAADKVTSETAASLYGSIMCGNRPDSVAVVNSWNKADEIKLLQDYFIRALHPRLSLLQNCALDDIDLTTFVPCNDMPLHFFWPRKSLAGIPVSHHAEFARSMPCTLDKESSKLSLGKVFHLGREEKNRIMLPTEILSSHTCIVGSPGSGKSNLSYQILLQLLERNINFLVIEPAKGEYSKVLGGYSSSKGEKVLCLSTRHASGDFLSVNPFAFPEGLNAFEHVESLLSLLETCWPMYAAMNDILKDAMLRIYYDAGWDMTDTGFPWKENYRFPTFQNLMDVLPKLIEQADYSNEVKDNYKGSLLTRVKSMTNGLNRKIFGCDGISDNDLFNKNVLVDISGVGSQENRALLMGLLIIRLKEFRKTENREMDSDLHHVTVLEEAHNLLSACQTTLSTKDVNISGKAVQLFKHAIAEMRSCGEGFIIVDQTPSDLDSSVTSNTATKIVFNLQNTFDSVPMGRAMALTEEQIEDISTLPQGVCIVRSRGWSAPVQIKIPFFEKSRYKPFQPTLLVKVDGEKNNLFGKMLAALLRNDLEQASAVSKNLPSNEIKSALLIEALQTLQEDEKLSADYLTSLFKHFFDADIWFRLPKKENVSRWDLQIRNELNRRARLKKFDQDSVIQFLLSSADKQKSKYFLQCWLEFNKTK